MLSKRNVISLMAASFLGAGAAGAQETPAKLKVVASFSVLADIAKQVGGDRVDVAALVGPNGDAHVYSPTPADARALSEAKAVIVNGLAFETWVERLLKASGAKAPVIVAAARVKAIKAADREHDHGHADGKAHDHAGPDPHAWQNVANVKLYVEAIRDGLAAADPAGGTAYEANAAVYLAKLDGLDAEIRSAVAKIPANRRKLITSHDAFGYFAAAYGISFVAPKGVSTEAEATARDVARIIRQVKAEKIPAVFMENVQDKRLAEQIARETGARIGGALFSDALSPPDGPAATYLDMMRHNIRQIAAALAPGGA